MFFREFGIETDNDEHICGHLKHEGKQSHFYASYNINNSVLITVSKENLSNVLIPHLKACRSMVAGANITHPHHQARESLNHFYQNVKNQVVKRKFIGNVLMSPYFALFYNSNADSALHLCIFIINLQFFVIKSINFNPSSILTPKYRQSNFSCGKGFNSDLVKNENQAKKTQPRWNFISTSFWRE